MDAPSRPVSLDRSAVAKDWHARGFSCGLWIDHGRREWSNPAHQSDELFMVLSGELELAMGGQSFTPAIGQEILIPAGVPYVIRNMGEHTARWLYGQPGESPQVPHAQTGSLERAILQRTRKADKKTAGVTIQNHV